MLNETVPPDFWPIVFQCCTCDRFFSFKSKRSSQSCKKLPFLKLDDTFFQYYISGLTDFQDISRLAISGPKIKTHIFLFDYLLTDENGSSIIAIAIAQLWVPVIFTYKKLKHWYKKAEFSLIFFFFLPLGSGSTQCLNPYPQPWLQLASFEKKVIHKRKY
jgi:hypothetical protein